MRLQMLSGDAHHVRRLIDADDAAERQPCEQLLSQPSRAASDVEHAFATVERQAREHDHAPVELRVGDAVIRLGVPLAHETYSGTITSLSIDGSPVAIAN